MSYLPPLPLPALACVLLAIYLLWIHRRSKRHHPQESRLQLPPPPRPHSDNNNENLSPKVQLLRCKLALAMKTACPIHAEVEAQRPGALDEAWDGGMRGPLFRHVGKMIL